MARNATLDDYFKVDDGTIVNAETQKSIPQPEKTGYVLTIDMLRNMDIEDIRDILSGCEKYGLDRDLIFIDKEDRISFEDRSNYMHESRRIDWYGNMHKEYSTRQKGPKVDFLVAYLGELTEEQKNLLYAERGFSTKSDAQFYLLRGRVYLSGFKMRNRNKKPHSWLDGKTDDFVKYNQHIYDKLVKNYNLKQEKSL